MTENLRKIVYNKGFIVILVLIGLISYGQLLGMNFWQDDNAVVFKFTHINEEAGYLGKGIFGDGPYRYTITPYLPIYNIFGYNPVAFFALALLCYLGSIVVVYFFFLYLLKDKVKASIAGLLYTAGYIASDGFIRMFNSVLASVTLMLVCSSVIVYQKFLSTKKLLWYLLGLGAFFLAVQIGYIRTHYLILVILGVEWVWLLTHNKSLKKFIQEAGYAALRLIPFFYIFYQLYLSDPDARSNQVKVLFLSLVHGQFYSTYSFFSSLGNILLPNEFYYRVFSWISQIAPSVITESKIVLFLITLNILFSYYLLEIKLISKKNAVLLSILPAFLLFSSRYIFNYPGLVGGLNEHISLYAGILFFVEMLILFWVLPYKRITSLLILWLSVNLAAYSAYLPMYSYPSDNRYLLHTFVPLIGLMSLYLCFFWQYRSHSKLTYIFCALIIFWGVFNFYSSVVSQHEIIVNRALPTTIFFNQLKSYYPSLPKGSILYFYIPDQPHAQEYYNAAISTAQMPNETSIAWRYGIDRYDLSLVNTFEDLKSKLGTQKVPLNRVYAFIAAPEHLINVTNQMRKLMADGATIQQQENLHTQDTLNVVSGGSNFSFNSVAIPTSVVSTITPVDTSITLSALPIGVEEKEFPIKSNTYQGEKIDASALNKYIAYKGWLTTYYKEASVSATASWKNFTPDLLLDKDPSTYWEADRILWDKPNQNLTVNLGQTITLGDLVYQNGPASLTPTKFDIQASLDNKTYQTIKNVAVDLSKRDQLQVIKLQPIEARYVRLIFRETQYNDAPGISEIQILPSSVSDIDVNAANTFLSSPFSLVDSLSTWNMLMNNFVNEAYIKLSWEKDNSTSWDTNVHAIVPIVYNDSVQTIKVEIPAGGHSLKAIKIEPLTIPGTISITQILYKNKTLEER